MRKNRQLWGSKSRFKTYREREGSSKSQTAASSDRYGRRAREVCEVRRKSVRIDCEVGCDSQSTESIVVV